MNSKHRALFLVWMAVLFANRATLGPPTGNPRTSAPMVAAPAAPMITILAAATGPFVRSLGAGNASLDLGHVSYFQGTSAPGQSVQKSSGSFAIYTRFGLRVDCPGSSSSSRVTVTMSRLDADRSDAISIDGTTLGSAAQTLVQSMPCGSAGEHRLDVNVPISTRAGCCAPLRCAQFPRCRRGQVLSAGKGASNHDEMRFMTRLARVVAIGVPHHVTQRGNTRQFILGGWPRSRF